MSIAADLTRRVSHMRVPSSLEPRRVAGALSSGLDDLAALLPDGARLRRMVPDLPTLPSLPSLSRREVSRIASGAANALGWFSIALGAVEMAMPGAVARAFGLGRHPNLVRVYGLREIAAGVGILSGHKRSQWLWGRVAGDLLDLATLFSGMGAGRKERANVKAALVVVAGITLIDMLAARALADED